MWKYDKAVIQNDLEFLQHHGIKGQKWGVRRFQNEDGSYTPAGRERYQISTVGRKSLGMLAKGRVRYAESHGRYKKPSEVSLKQLRKLDRLQGESGRNELLVSKTVYEDAVKRAKWNLNPTKSEELARRAFQRKQEYEDAALRFVDAYAQKSLNYIQENFSGKQQDEVAAFIYDHMNDYLKKGWRGFEY